MAITNKRFETTAEGFRKLDQNVIFIAGSQDIKSLRSDVEWAIRNTIHRLTPGSELKPYSWDIETSDTGFDQTKSMQKNLPRPSDEKCLGVVCLMAERIGHPLEDESILRLIDNVEDWTRPSHQYRLVHPWPPKLERQKRLLEKGCYPLTGTVFEFIDGYSALGAAKKPVWFCVIADRPIEPYNNQSVMLGNYQFRTEKSKKLSDPDFDRWKQDDYNLQTLAVKNFVCALAKKGIDQNAINDREKIIESVKRFVTREIIQNSAQSINPYKFLGHFDVSDVDNFCGRDKETKRAIRELDERFNSPHDFNVIRIVGRSGAGKSSFLRAGLIAPFQQSQYRGDVNTVVFRPTDFQRADGGRIEIIRSILDFFELQTGIRIPAADRDVYKRGPRAAQLSIKLLQSLLPEATNGKRSKLIFGVDQFEEIVDYLSDQQQVAQWYPIIQFIDWAGRSESIGAAYTLESSRKERLKQLGLPSIFMESYEIEIDDFSSELIHSIIEEPFRKSGYPLSRNVVSKLVDNARALRRVDGVDVGNSILPLVALRLSKLFDSIQNRREPITDTDRTETSGTAFDESASRNPSFVQLDEVDGDLDFDDMIKEEAERAWKEGTDGENVKPNAIDHFLLPLVGIGGPNLDEPQLQTMQWPHYLAEKKLAKSFKRRRLLLPAAKGLRLVHKAVIRHWPDANRWFENNRDFLKKQVLFRHKASEWASNGKPENVDTITEDNIGDAADILYAHRRTWLWGQEVSASLADDDKLLREYCLFVFRRSKTPTKEIRYTAEDPRSHVYLAALYGMVNLLEDFRQIDPNCLERVTQSEQTLLHAAAWAHADAVKYLLEKGVNPAHKDKQCWPPIVSPIQMGRMDIFKQLLKASNGSGSDGPSGSTMLHWCARYGQVEMAIQLEGYGLDANHPDENQWMPLHYAARNGQVETFTHFAKLSDISEVCRGGFTCLHLAAVGGHTAIVDYLVNEPRFQPCIDAETDTGSTALHLASRNKHAEVVSMLLQVCDPNWPVAETELRPLHLALESDDPSYDQDSIFETVCALLGDPRTDPNAPDDGGNSPLALSSKLPNVQKYLLRHPKLDPALPISEDGEIPLTVSAKLCDWEAFRALEEHSPTMHGLVDKEGNTMLHLFIERPSPQELIEKTLSNLTSADLNALNNNGLTPLLVAIEKKKWALARRLLSLKEIEPMRRGGNALSALMLALKQKADKDTLSKLVEICPSLLTEKDYLGLPPLHKAVVSQQLEWIRWLNTAAGDSSALWDQTDNMGRKPIDLASPFVRSELSRGEEGGDWPAPKSWDSDLKWEPVESIARVDLVDRINPIDGHHAIDNDAEIHTAALSFYDPETVQIIRIKSPVWNNSELNIYYLNHEETLYRLGGTSPPIHEVNAKAQILLNADNVLNYLRYFCFFMRAEEGPFLVAESPSQQEIPSALTETEMAELLKVLRPACLIGYDKENAQFLVMAPIYYSNGIYLADLSIQKTGMIDMIQDVAVMEGLSAKVYKPLA